MSQIGSFALLLALGLSAYSFGAGLLALFGRDAASARLGETARRAGIATFGAVVLAAFVLVTAAFNDDFSIAYIFHHSNRELARRLQVRRSLVRAGRLAAVLVAPAGRLRIRSPPALQDRPATLRLRVGHHRERPGLLSSDLEFRRPPVRHRARSAFPRTAPA